MAASKIKKNAWTWVCFIAYLFVLFYMLFFAEVFGRTEHVEEYRYNITLFQEINRFYQYGKSHNWDLFLINVVGNVVVFIPFGVFLPRLFTRCRNLFLTILLSLELSLAVEVTQLLSRVGRFDVDDLFLNTIGGLLGYLLVLLWTGAKGKRRTARNGK